MNTENIAGNIVENVMERVIDILQKHLNDAQWCMDYITKNEVAMPRSYESLQEDIAQLQTAIQELSGRRLTGFADINGTPIREGDILSDEVETDSGIVTSYKQVFFNTQRGMWMIDDSFSQDKHSGSILSSELLLFDYHITGNIVEHDYLIHPITDKCG